MIRKIASKMIFIFLFTLGTGSLYAQGISLGGRFGAVAGNVLFEYEETNDLIKPMLGFQAGGVAAYRLRFNLSLQAELWYIQKGWTETPAGGARRFSYVELPLFLTATAPWTTAPQLLLGASVSRELSCRVTGVPGVGSLSCGDPRVKWNHAKTQFGIWGGFGVRRQFGAGYLAIQLLGNLNLTNLDREPLLRGYSKLLSFTVSAMYIVQLGGRTP